jgi:subtilase family serine protease
VSEAEEFKMARRRTHSTKKRGISGWAKSPILGAILTISCGSLLLFFPTVAGAAERQVLNGHIPTAVTDLRLQPTGRLPGSTNLYLVIGLTLRNTGALTNLLEQLYDPSSPQYHHWLTPNQFAEMFGPTEQDYQALIAFANANGLTVTGTHPNRTLLDVKSSVVNIERVFHVAMRVYQHPKEARTFYAPDVEPSIDLSVPLLHISGLNNFVVPHPMINLHPKKLLNTAPSTGSGTSGSYWGNDFRNTYAPGVSLTGAGQAVGLLQLDGYYASDIATYTNNAKIY